MEDKLWRPNEAKCAWCTICNRDVKWMVGEVNYVKSHMTSYHSDLLRKSEAVVVKASKNATMTDYFTTSSKCTLKAMIKADQSKGEAILAKWMGESLRPFTLVEDGGFREFVQYLNETKGHFKVPGRLTISSRMESLASFVKERMRELFVKEMDYFAATTDMWTGRTSESFIAITIHYLTEEFEQRNFTIEIAPVRGRHTGEHIASLIREAFDRWALPLNKLSIMARDNGSNVVSACNKLDITHQGCVGHSIHLVVNPFLKNEAKQTNASTKMTEHEALEKDDEEDYEDDIVGFQATSDVRVTSSAH